MKQETGEGIKGARRDSGSREREISTVEEQEKG